MVVGCRDELDGPAGWRPVALGAMRRLVQIGSSRLTPAHLAAHAEQDIAEPVMPAMLARQELKRQQYRAAAAMQFQPIPIQFVKASIEDEGRSDGRSPRLPF